jgi:hypothetical protein
MSETERWWATIYDGDFGSRDIYDTEEEAQRDAKAWGTRVVAVVPADQLRRAVSLLDDLSDVLAEVQRGELPVDDARVNDVLRRSVLHVNGGQSDLEFRQIAASDHTT